MKRYRVLVVDDEERILSFLQAKLKAVGHDVLIAHDGLEALEQAEAQEPDLIVLDLVMPKKNGFEVLKELRSFSSVPVIMLTGRSDDADKIRGLTIGADDYLAKPFNPDELVARIEAIRRRFEPAKGGRVPERLCLGNVTVDFQKRAVVVNGDEKTLTRIEWLLLSKLARNVGRLITYEELLTEIWGPEYRSDVQLLRTWVSRLRYKLEREPNNPQLIRTIAKTGYIIDQPSSEPSARVPPELTA